VQCESNKHLTQPLVLWQKSPLPFIQQSASILQDSHLLVEVLPKGGCLRGLNLHEGSDSEQCEEALHSRHVGLPLASGKHRVPTGQSELEKQEPQIEEMQ
jgi:hypothetical protein